MMDGMRPDDIHAAPDGLADTLASIESGALDATDAQRAYLAGALDALRGLTGSRGTPSTDADHPG